jgi:ABC-2 type transport system permease protein
MTQPGRSGPWAEIRRVYRSLLPILSARERRDLRIAVWAEWLKLRRSRTLMLTGAAAALMPVIIGLIMLSGNADAFGMTGDWKGYWSFLVKATAGSGLLLFGVLVAWIFGREFSDRTAIDLLALPTPPSSTVNAKFSVFIIWSAALVGLVVGGGIVVALMTGLPGGDLDVLTSGARDVTLAGGLTVVVLTPVGLVSSLWRGYLPGIGLLLLLLPLSQVLGATGLGPWFPWDVPGLASAPPAPRHGNCHG